jgi:starvation-inducible DNA-binding protein
MKRKALDEKTIDKITKQLSHFLSDTFVLYVKTLNFHWNMVGTEFFMYHKLLEKQYEDMAKAIDEIAERIRMLGRIAPGTMADFLKLSSLKEGSSKLGQKQMIKELVESHENLVEECHELIQFTESVNDQGTSDLVIEQIRFHAKQAWLLRSHL